MNLAVITTAFYPADKWKEQLKMFRASCEKYGIEFIPYGIDQPYCIWAEMKIAKKLPVFAELIRDGYTHVLYTDSRDAFFTGGLDEIIAKYKRLGSPACLASTEKNCNPNSKYIENYPGLGTEYRFHCVGGYIADIRYMTYIFERMVEYIARSGDDAEIWQWAWDEGWFRPALDTYCDIFQVGDRLQPGELQMYDGRLTNMVTHSEPCILHLNGGYSDPVTGKWDAMVPWWTMIHGNVDSLGGPPQ